MIILYIFLAILIVIVLFLIYWYGYSSGYSKRCEQELEHLHVQEINLDKLWRKEKYKV